MRKALGCTVLSLALAGGIALPAQALPSTPTKDTTTLTASALSPTAAAKLRPALAVGSRSPAVTYVQRKLGVTPVTGYYGPLTQAAVKALQKQKGLAVTGKVNKSTWTVLLAAKGVIKLPAAKPTTTKPTTAKPTTAKPTTSKPTTSKPAVKTPAQAAATKPQLSQGSSGPAVVYVQQYLSVTPASGYFGSLTKAAVKKYQKGMGITASGTIGPLTWTAILAGRRPAATPSTPAPTATPEAPDTPTTPTTPATPVTPVSPAIDDDSTAGEIALAYALAQVGKKYVLGGNGPNVFDCSGLVQQAYLRAGIKLPRLASQQRYAGTRVSLSELLPGDLLYYQDGTSPRKGHISMYAGNGLAVEAANPRRGVRIRALNEPWYRDRFVAATRIG